MYDPYTSTHTIIRVTVKKRHHLAPRFGTCMYDPYTSTHTIIRETVKKCHHLAPRFATCMYIRPIFQHSHHHKSNRQKVSTAHPQICHLYMYDPYTSTHTIIRVTAKKRQQLTPRFATSVCMTHIPALTPS